MKHRAILAAFCTLVIALVGCERKTATFSVAPFEVNGDTGIATGEALGIDILVAGASEARLISSANLKPGEPAQSSGRAEITLADDVEIELEMIPGGRSIAFQLNGKKFGDLERGDEVVIDEDRNVAINGTQREHRESPPEK